jgi:hypothetical protein
MPRGLIAQVVQKLANGIMGFVLFVSEFWILENLCLVVNVVFLTRVAIHGH